MEKDFELVQILRILFLNYVRHWFFIQALTYCCDRLSSVQIPALHHIE